MLLEFSCSNHKSIKDKVFFSAIAGSDSSHANELYEHKKYKVLRMAAIYGANGSGKSNFVNAIDFMRALVTNSIKHQPGETILQQPHKLSGKNPISEYNSQFVIHDVRYAYGFSLRNGLVYEEYLYYFPKGRAVKIFERNGETYIDGDKFKGAFALCKDARDSNRLYLSCAANFSSVKPVKDAFIFFKDSLVIYGPNSQDNWMKYSLTKLHDDKKTKELVITLIKSFGINITDISVNIQKKPIENSQIPPILSDDVRLAISKQEVEHFDARIVYDHFMIDLMKEESDGLRKLIAFLCPFIDILLRGKVLFCDEIETNFHEAIVCGLVKLLKDIKTGNQPQLILTTHDTSILDLDIFRRDQIWFTEMSVEGRSTQLYSLAEIKNVRKGESVSKGYIAGKYGAIPMLNKSLAEIISNQ